MIETTQIPEDQLRVGRWYVGRGRNANVGLWDGENFLVISMVGRKVGPGPGDWNSGWSIKVEPYFTATSGCFQPFAVIDEGVVAEVYPEPGERYAIRLRFDDPT